MTHGVVNTASVFEHPGWATYIEETQGLKAQPIKFGQRDTGSTYASLHGFVNERGRLRMPKVQPYLAVRFEPTPVETARKLESQWIGASAELAQQMHDAGYASAINLDPSIQDVRAWQVTGLHAEVRYTYHISLPFDIAQASNAVRKNLRKADRAGLTSGPTTDVDAVVRSLEASERRQGFQYSVTAQHLERLTALLGRDMVRLYACRDSFGNVISARVVLVGLETAVDWVAGTHSDALHTGSTQQLIYSALQDIDNDNVKLFDFGGANIPSIARSKMEWGGTLTPFYSLRPNTPRTLALDGRTWLTGVAKKLRAGRG